jgi:2-deoxy-D-gluconate 3-dehydrogenase
MKSGGGGKIINIGSMTVIFGSKRSIPYGASKSGLVQLTKSLALSWAPNQIQVNAILPGWVETEMTIGLRDSEDTEIKRIYGSINERIPAGRWARPEDIAGAAVFLASAASDYVTGAVLTVDGGYSIA